MNSYKQIITELHNLNDSNFSETDIQKIIEYMKMANKQRGNPERALQFLPFKDDEVIRKLAEYGGDIINRTYSVTYWPTAGYKIVKSKVEFCVSLMNDYTPGGLNKIVELENLKDGLLKYKNEYKTLKFDGMNDCYKTMIELCLFIGYSDWTYVRYRLNTLRANLTTEENWVKYAYDGLNIKIPYEILFFQMRRDIKI